MKIHLLTLILFCSLSASGQGLFLDKYDNCRDAIPCLYCGDTVAHPSQNLNEFIKWELEHSNNGGRFGKIGLKVIFEIYIDSTGHPCVLSIKDESFNWGLKDYLRRSINSMPNWIPAIKNGKPINSTVLLQVDFRDNWFWTQLISPEKLKPVIKEKKKKHKDDSDSIPN